MSKAQFKPFSNMVIFKSDIVGKELGESDIIAALEQIPFVRPKSEKSRSGFVPPHIDIEVPYYVSTDKILFCLKTEVKKIDASEKKELVEEKKREFRAKFPDLPKIPKDKLSEFNSEVEDYLYREKFISKFTISFGYIDINKGLMIIDKSSLKNATAVNDILNKSLNISNMEHKGFGFKPIKAIDDISYQLSEWVNDPAVIPEDFELGGNCSLSGSEDFPGNITYKGKDLSDDEQLRIYINDQQHDITKMKLVYSNRDDSDEDETSSFDDLLDFDLNIDSDSLITSYKLGSCYKLLLAESSYDTDIDLFDLEFNSFVTLSDKVIGLVYDSFGGFKANEVTS